MRIFSVFFSCSPIRPDRDTAAYFKATAAKTGLPYQRLINLYLRDCAVHQRELRMKWAP